MHFLAPNFRTLTAATGLTGIEPSSTAWRRAERKTPRACAIVAEDKPLSLCTLVVEPAVQVGGEFDAVGSRISSTFDVTH